MSWALTNLNGVVDVGFVLLVSAVCVRSLTNSNSGVEKIATRWREELRELERVLRELIAEAGTASSSLDRRLLRRKAELETLLTRIEDGKAAAAPKVPAARANSNNKDWELGASPDFPNDSWVDSIGAVEEEIEREDYETDTLGGLEELVESAEDTIELSTKIEKSIVTRQTKAPIPKARALPPTPSAQATSNALAAQIEKIQADQNDLEEQVAQETFKRLSIMDPTAYRIARRLLAEGTEIHVVARKLDLPVSEIRLLDRLMREESVQRAKDLEVGPNYKPTEIVPAKKIVRSSLRQKQLATRTSLDINKDLIPAATSKQDSPRYVKNIEQELDLDVEGEIERELALL